VTTHLLLAARAFGASGAVYTGRRDLVLEETISDVVSEWGGSFDLRFSESWRSELRDWGGSGRIVHLTMYGLPVQDVVAEIRGCPSDLLVVVGGAKVPGEVYDLADWNVAVTSQPHSEVSALAVFLHELSEGRGLEGVYEGARLRVVPQAQGKRIEDLSRGV
jgi:tRNA (cytidine56-2'-O)-methyltransferase